MWQQTVDTSNPMKHILSVNNMFEWWSLASLYIALRTYCWMHNLHKQRKTDAEKDRERNVQGVELPSRATIHPWKWHIISRRSLSKILISLRCLLGTDKIIGWINTQDQECLIRDMIGWTYNTAQVLTATVGNISRRNECQRNQRR